MADIQRELDQLEARSANVDVLLAENAKNIYGGASQGLNGVAEATLGPIFVHQKEYKSIEKTITQATRDLTAAEDTAAEAVKARQSGQLSLAIAKTEEAVALARKAGAESQDAYEQSSKTFERILNINKAFPGTLPPEKLKDLAKELAQRYWESRPYVIDAAKGFARYLNANEEQPLLIALKGELNGEIAQLTDLKTKQAFAPQAPLPETSTPHLPVGRPPAGPPPVTVTPQGTEKHRVP